MTDNQTPQTDEQLPHVGWWCWRGDNHGHLATQPCRSDNVPVHVPAEWADEMRAVIQRIEDGDEEQPETPTPAVPAAVPPTTRTADDLADRLEAVLAKKFTELGNPFAEMRVHEQGPDGWPASHPVGPHKVAEVLRELLAEERDEAQAQANLDALTVLLPPAADVITSADLVTALRSAGEERDKVHEKELADLRRKLAAAERIRENADFHLGQEMARRQLAEKETARLSTDRGAVLNAAAQHLYTALFPAVYNDLGQKAAEGVNRAVSELRRLADEAQQPVAARHDGADRVRALHQPDANGECQGCNRSFDPCPTIAALDGKGEAQQQPETQDRSAGCCGRPPGAICVHDHPAAASAGVQTDEEA